MSKSRFETKVGLFVFVGLALIAILLVQFRKGLSFFKPTHQLLLLAPDVGGVKPNAAVMMSGVQIGSVESIKLTPQGNEVMLTLKLYKQYRIHKDARFSIQQSGFLGDQYVAVSPTKNEGEVFKDGEMARAEAPFNLQEVARSATLLLQHVEDTAQKLNDAIVDVHRLVLNEATLTNLANSAITLRKVSERALITIDSVGSLVDSNAPVLAVSSSNLMAFSAELKQATTNLNLLIEENKPALDHAVKNIADSTEILKSLMTDVQAGKGTAGALLRNEQMAANLSNVVYNLSITTSNLNQRGLWGIMWKQKHPPEKSSSK